MQSIKSFVKVSFLLIIVIVIASLPVSTAKADTVGPNNPGSGTNIAGLGSEAWLNPGNITSPGSPYSTVTLYQGHRYSNYLAGSQYGFAIPADAAVMGIEVSINRMSSSRNPNVIDNVVRLVKAGSIVGENKASLNNWETYLSTVVYGGPTDLWGTTWTPADVNNAEFGVVLAVYRDNNGNNSRDALVDSLQISVYYEYNSQTTVACGNGTPVVYGDSVSCLATVTAMAGAIVPSGNVDWSTGGSGTFDPDPCQLIPQSGSAFCTTDYTPTAVGTGTHLVVGTYGGDSNFTSSNDSDSVTVVKADPLCTVTPYQVTYDGNEHSATGSCVGVFGETLTGLDLSATAHTDAGSYTDTWTYTDTTGNYNNATGTVNDVVSQANPSCSVTPYNVPYDGLAHTADGNCTGVDAETLVGLDLSATTHTTAGSYNDLWTYTDVTGNYNDASGTVNDQISKIAASCTVTPYSVTFDGLTHTASGACTGLNGTPLSGLDLSGTTHTDAGSYTDAWTFTDVTGNYNNQSGTVNDAIAKADAVCNVTPYDVTYDGNNHTASGTCQGVDDDPLAGLDLSATTHMNAGSYTDPWTFTDVSGNYNNSSGTVVDLIGKANPACVVTPYHLVYDGEAHLASGACTGVKGESLGGLNLDNTAHTNVGSYNDAWSFTDQTGNYYPASGTVNDVITKAAPSCTVTGYLVEYDKQAHTAAGACTGVKGEALSGLNLAGTTHTDVGQYLNDPWTYTDATGNYNNLSGTVNNEITRRAITVQANARSKMVGQPDPALTYQVTAGTLLAGDSFSGGLTRQPGEAPGTYAILLGTLSLPDYYEITFVGANFTINVARMIIPLVYR